MIDQIKSKIANSGKQESANASKQAKEVVNTKNIAQNSTKSSESTTKSNISKFISKDMVKNMAKEPPINSANVSRIKTAIANGSYPINIEKVSDALFDAYKEMKD